MKNVALVFLTGFVCSFVFGSDEVGSRIEAKGYENLYWVEGRIKVENKGLLYLALIDEKAFSDQGVALLGLTFRVPEETKSGPAGRYIDYRLQAPGPGVFALRAFVDSNGNGKLDGGLFGPTEAWGFSGNFRPSFRGPEFREVSFRIAENSKTARVDFEVRL